MLQRIATYRQTGGWLVQDIFRILSVRIWLLLALTGAVLVSQVALFGTFILFIRILTTGEPLTIDQINLSLAEGDTIVWASALLSAGMAMALLTVWEADYRNRLAARYAQSAVSRVIAILTRPDTDLSLLAHRARSSGQIKRLLTGDFLIMARAAIALMQALLPTLKLIVAVPLLFYLYPETAVFLPALALVYATPYYLLSKRVVNASRQREKNAGRLSEAAKFVADEITANQQVSNAAHCNAAEAYTNSKPVKDQLKYYHIFRTTNSALQGLNSVFLTVLIIGIITLFGDRPPEDTIVNMAIFAIVLLHAFSATNSLTASAALFNRFIPNIERYTVVLRQGANAGCQASRPSSSKGQKPVFRRASDNLLMPQSLEKISPNSGETCAVIGLGSLQLKSVDSMLQALGGRRAFKSRRPLVAVANSILSSRPIWRIASSDKAATPEHVRERLRLLLGDTIFDAETKQLPDGLNTLWSDSSKKIDDALALAVLVAPALDQDITTILVPIQSWSAICLETRERFRRALPHVVWIIVADCIHMHSRDPFDYVVFATQDGIVGLGTWGWARYIIECHPDLIGSIVKRTGQSKSGEDEPDDG